jgi:uncharacterized protein (DUF433 family)
MATTTAASPSKRRPSQRVAEWLYSRREVAELTGAPLTAVNKVIEQGVVRPRRGRGGQVLLTLDDLVAIAVFDRAAVALPASVKRKVRTWIRNAKPHRARSARRRELPIGSSLLIRVEPELLSVIQDAESYAVGRKRYIERHPGVKSREPVIRGTRLPVRAVAARLAAGDPVESLVEDYPYIDREAFSVAARYARAHPRRGRPPRPWRGR